MKTSQLPRVCTIGEFASHFGLKLHQGYAHFNSLPESCKFRIGRRVWVNMDALAAHMNGGQVGA